MMLLAGVLLTIEGTTLGALSWMLEPLFDKVFKEGNSGLLWLVGGGIFGLFLIRAITSIGSRTVMAHVAYSTSSALQIDLLRHMLRLDQRFYQRTLRGT